MKNFSSLLLFLLLLFLIQWVGYKLTMTTVNDWYLTLEKPGWTPPSWLFGPVWTILYVMIAISGWLISVKINTGQQKYQAFTIYGLQLFSNLTWSYLFFYLKSPRFALLDIILLNVLIVVNIIAFSRLHKPAGVLLIPYLIWTLYAAALNAAIWQLNR